MLFLYRLPAADHWLPGSRVLHFDMRPGGKWVFTMHGPDKDFDRLEVELQKMSNL
ncbi:MAG TPA: hypothetical protein VM802_18285 [Chitinophaga sp.]|uniref:hypothetical protein n=1 Tax=Chitinophaga sp. TaxID=1869181 RepID=UPI002B9D76C3|nr:hypothetical protein [Chitinophaga sp.]HVI46834.1 hypothetical protein [Chitinophaga sp.]